MQLRTLAVLIVVIAIAMAALAACSSSDDDGDIGGAEATPTPTAGGDGTPTEAPSNGDGEVNACAAMSGTEVEAVLGVPVGEADRKPIGFTDSCTYFAEEDSIVGASLQMATGISDERFDEIVAESEEIFEESSVPVSGIGDEAAWLFGSLFVRKGDTYLQLTLTLGFGEEDNLRDQTETLMTTVLGNLP